MNPEPRNFPARIIPLPTRPGSATLAAKAVWGGGPLSPAAHHAPGALIAFPVRHVAAAHVVYTDQGPSAA